MNAPMTKFAIMRANREKRRQIAAYGRILDAISRNALGVHSPVLGFPVTPESPIVSQKPIGEDDLWWKQAAPVEAET